MSSTAELELVVFLRRNRFRRVGCLACQRQPNAKCLSGHLTPVLTIEIGSNAPPIPSWKFKVLQMPYFTATTLF